ncbi:hypothetical protein [Pedobacter faecalis]|uniref:hypothetical protein n=1 Tax=Pedobacter faecalis TaxID=3041495 RepID=UPI00254D8F0F|nr:hypothetical protein [Pedobacter sp. ELA7]
MRINHDFTHLSDRESGEVYPSLIDNAERHFSVAHHIFTVGDYPNSVAHLILGAEEMVYATLLLLRSKALYPEHIISYHELLAPDRRGNGLIMDFFKVWFNIREILKLAGPKKQYSLKNLFQLLVVEFTGLVTGKDSLTWWQRADALKERCLHVHYSDGIVLPDIQVSKSDYNLAHHYVYLFRYEFYALQHKLINASDEDLTDLREQIDNREFAGVLKSILSSKRQTQEPAI